MASFVTSPKTCGEALSGLLFGKPG